MKQYDQKTEMFATLHILEQKGNKFYFKYNLRFFMHDGIRYCSYSEAVLNHAPTRKDRDKLEKYDKNRAKEYMMQYVDFYFNETKEFLYCNGTKRAWLNSEQRASILNSIMSAKLNKDTSIDIYLNDDIYNLDLERATAFILAIQDYSDKCYHTYKKHKKVLSSLNDLDSILDYQTDINYPNKLYFN